MSDAHGRIVPFCVEALENYRQADMDRIMVLVSRQAIHETIDAYWARVKTCEELEAKLAKAVEALSLTRRADDLREAYHRLPNDRNRIGDKKSKKSRARDAWLRAFRKAAKEARAINGGGDE